MFAAKRKYKPWQSPKLFLNGNEWFEYNCHMFTLIVGRRLLHIKDGKMIGAATIRKLKLQ
jgi:hypothetical protein